jgi:hypothetical protein
MRLPASARIGTLAVVALTLASCSPASSGGEPVSTSIPAALDGSELGVVSSEAGTRNDGLALNLWVSAEFEADTLTEDDLRTLLQLVVDSTSQSGFYELSITASVAPGDTAIDLGTLGERLGFPQEDNPEYDSVTDFSAEWDDVVDFLDE